MRNWRTLLLTFLFLVLALFPVFWGDPYYLHLLILFFVFGTLVSSWNILFGYMGIFCFGQQAFFRNRRLWVGHLCHEIRIPCPSGGCHRRPRGHGIERSHRTSKLEAARTLRSPCHPGLL